MRILISYCGTNSITGAICQRVLDEKRSPSEVTIDIDVVMSGTDVMRELEKARKTFKERSFQINLGTVRVDHYKEALASGARNVPCFS